MKTIGLCAFSILVLGLVSEAKAAIIDITYTGTVGTASTDGTGIFGPPSSTTPLTGDAYTLTYQFDTSAGLLSTGTNYVQLAGGPGYGPALVNPYSSPGAATLTINGQSVTVAIPPTSQNGNSASQAFVANQGSQIFVEQKIQNEVSTATDLVHYGIDTYFYLNLLSALQLTTPLTLNFGPANQVYSSFSFYDFNYGTSSDAFLVYGQLDPTSVTVSFSATPLPASWTMMLIGIAGFGFVSYRRKNTLALNAA